MTIDRISQRNLELVEPIFADGKGNTLLSVLDRTVTPMGARRLREWVLRPLRSKSGIEERLDAVGELVADPIKSGHIMSLCLDLKGFKWVE